MKTETHTGKEGMVYTFQPDLTNWMTITDVDGKELLRLRAIDIKHICEKWLIADRQMELEKSWKDVDAARKMAGEAHKLVLEIGQHVQKDIEDLNHIHFLARAGNKHGKTKAEKFLGQIKEASMKSIFRLEGLNGKKQPPKGPKQMPKR